MNKPLANIDGIEKLKASIEGVKGSLSELVDVVAGGKDQFEETSDSMSERMKGLDEAATNIARKRETESKSFLTQLGSIGSEYKKMVADMQKEGGIGGALAAGMPSQLGGVQDGISKLKGSILSELPFGGLVGLMVLGGQREEEVRAMGAQIGRVFQQAGQVGKKEMAEIGASTRELGVMLGKGPTGLGGEIASSAAAFAQAGVDIKDVLENKFSVPIRGSRGSILETSTALDSLFKQAAGTAAREMSDLIRNFNMEATESAKVVAAIGLSARDSGTSVASFTTSILQSSQALRTQRIDVTELAGAQLKFQKLMEDQMPGINQQFAAGFAERAMGQVTQGLSGMSVGLSAVLGERITARRPELGGGQAATGLEAYYAMREGFSGQGQNDQGSGMFAESIKELAKMASEGGRNAQEQRFFLEKMGFGFEGAKAIQSLGSDMREAEAQGLDSSKVIEKHQGELNRAFVDRAKETSDFQRALLRIQDGIAKIGAGLLGAVVSGFQSMYYGIIALTHKISDPLGRDTETQARFSAAMEMMGKASAASTRSVDLIGKGLKEAGMGVELGIQPIMARGAGGESEVYQRHLRAAGLETEIAGKKMSRDEALSLQSGARGEIQGRALTEIDELASASGVKKSGMFEPSTQQEYAINQIKDAYRRGGADAAQERARGFQERGVFRGTNFQAGLVGDAQRSAENATMEIDGKQIRLKVITETRVVPVGVDQPRTAE